MDLGWDRLTGLEVAAIAGLLGGAVSLVDPLPYIRDVARRRTRPHRGTWLIWAVLGSTAFASQLASEGGWSLAVLGVQAVSTALILVLSLRHGVGGVSASELALLAVAAVGIAGWLVSDEPVVASVCVVVADLAGVLLMVPKTWADPWSETAVTFGLSAVAGALGVVAVGRADPGLLLYPAYFGLINLGTTVLILGRRRALPASDGPAGGGPVRAAG